MDGGHEVILLFLDLSAAFDTVDHQILLQRMSVGFGIQGTALEWLQSYLSNRQQFVSIDGVHSSMKPLQGTVLDLYSRSVTVPPLYRSNKRNHEIPKHELSYVC